MAARAAVRLSFLLSNLPNLGLVLIKSLPRRILLAQETIYLSQGFARFLGQEFSIFILGLFSQHSTLIVQSRLNLNRIAPSSDLNLPALGDATSDVSLHRNL